jgi:hypothetical protein
VNAKPLTKTKNEIVTDIKFYIANHGGRYRDWYVGVSADAKDRLFQGHKVDKEKDMWIYRRAVSSTVAREVEDHLVNMLGIDGGPGGGDDNADMVYVYKKGVHTEP